MNPEQHSSPIRLYLFLVRFQPSRTWFIDEICLDNPDLLDLAEEVARLVRGSAACMGGIRIVSTGDVAQCPPLGTEEQLVAHGLRPRRDSSRRATESRSSSSTR